MDVTRAACEVVVEAAAVDAGGELALVGRVWDPELRGQSLEIRNHEGQSVAELPLTEVDGDRLSTLPSRVRAPDIPGSYAWTAQMVGPAADDRPEPADFKITVTEHATRVMVWAVPPAVEAGADFTARVGLKCSSGCDMAGRGFSVFDHFGRELVAGEMTEAIWPGSEGLHVADVVLTSPEEPGLVRWQVRASAVPGTAHKEGACDFGVRTVAPADVTLRIEAVDSERGDPLPRMSVLVHPYRAQTDEHGVAEIKVARGRYSVSVSGRGYYPVRRSIELTEDMTTRAPLEAEPPPSKDW